ncbi:hypothetical protein E3Q18_02288 [Wallemia mellicola]|nr:hypothetical protein E3Q19_01880 [Wallemia mellicola]TIB98031.1 hypothetical protein E3Q18_02288 [Wallemia mellicola]
MEYQEEWLENLIEAFAERKSDIQQLNDSKSNKLVIRNSDLIFAERNEIKIMSLSELKASDPSTSNINLKTLHTPTITFDIQSLVLNSTKKLLAVVGSHQVVVVVLPRPGYSKLVTPLIECRSIQVGQYYHAIKGSSEIAKVDWHPWSLSASSLMVLTRDANFREYDISIDSEDPQQSISFVQAAAMPGSVTNQQFSNKSKGFSADDERSTECVSFDIGRGDSDWGPLTLYGLMKNGDVFAICPFMPNNAQVPTSYIQNLKGITEAKLMKVTEDSLIEARLSQQMRWLNAVVKQIKLGEENIAGFKCNPPRATGSLLRQGPYLVQPAPTDEEYESDASDILIIRPKDCPVDIFVVAFTDGRVDICLEVVKAEGRWSSKAVSTNICMKMDLIILQESHATPPIISTYESIKILQSHDFGYPTLSKDPIYEDTIYISHAEGVHALVFKPWLDELDQVDSLTRDSTLVHVIRTSTTSSAQSTPIVALDVINDAYLGYLLFALTNTMQILPLDLSLRVQTDPETIETKPKPQMLPKVSDSATSKPSSSNQASNEERKLYSSLLESPFIQDQPDGSNKINLSHKLAPVNTRAEIQVTPQTLRYMGGVVENVRHHNQNSIQTGNNIQDRLSLQLKETEKQIEKLAHVAKIATNPSNEAGVGTGKGARVEKVSNEQSELLKRMDNLLQRLMDKHQPTLSTHEKKWFAELGRIRDEVSGTDSKGRALQARMSRVGLSHQLELLKPQVQSYEATEAMKRSQTGIIGSSQIAKVESVLQDETKAIEELRVKLDTVTKLLRTE